MAMDRGMMYVRPIGNCHVNDTVHVYGPDPESFCAGSRLDPELDSDLGDVVLLS